MANLFNRFSNIKLNKLVKSRLNKDGFALVDAIVAFTILAFIVILALGFVSTAIRTAPLIESDAEDHQATMIAVAKSVAKTSDVEDFELSVDSYVPSRSLTEPNILKIYNNYNSSTKKLDNPDGGTHEILSKNIIPASYLQIHIHPMTNQWVQVAKTPKVKGATFTFEGVKNLNVTNKIPNSGGFFNIYRAEKQQTKLKDIDTLNYPKSYMESEMLIYENTIK